MALDLLRECMLTGPAFPEPFVRFELEKELAKASLLPRVSGEEGRALQEAWEAYRRKLRELAVRGGAVRVRNHVLEPLISRLGYARLEPAEDVHTREGRESGGYFFFTADGSARLRAWCTDFEEDLEAPARRGAAYRYSHVRSAQRVMLTAGERLGLLTNGVELRLLISDPARPDSQIIIPIDPVWKRSRDIPDCYWFLLALASPAGVQAIPALVEKARLQQTRVTTELRKQARQAIELFIQEVLDHADNRDALASDVDAPALAKELWREGLITVYRLLFIFKLEAGDDPARSFSFASTSLWRNTFSPSVALAPYVRAVLDHGVETGHLLEGGLRTLFRMFAEGLQCTELNVQPLGGALFGTDATLTLSRLKWGERAVAYVLDRLLWTPKVRGSEARERVHYGSLDVEDLGRVYEALLELEPGITTEPMCRLRRQKLEVVVPMAQGEKYRPTIPESLASLGDIEETEEPDDTGDEHDDEAVGRSRKTMIEWIEAIPPGRFYLRVGLGRKATGSYYTPHSFVRFLVQETLAPLVAERSPEEDPRPGEILKLKVLDPAMGSGHFLVETCRFLGEKLYEACRLCDERTLAAERRAEQIHMDAERNAALIEADEYRWRIQALPDPDDELVRYLPSRAPEGEESGLSQKKAEALCRRLVAIHCLYGVDKNPLAVELAKLALWIESHAEGLPLTFLDHRLILGDSLTGPFFEHLLKYPGTQEPLDDLFTQGLRESFTNALGNALKHVDDIKATVGANLAETEAKLVAKARLDRALAPFRVVAAAWAGGVMLSDEHCDDPSYARLVGNNTEVGDLPEDLSSDARLLRMIARGLGVTEIPSEQYQLLRFVESGDYIPALPYDLVFPDVFFPKGALNLRGGFDAVLGNPPWDAIQFKSKEFFASFDFEILNASTKRERDEIEHRILANSRIAAIFDMYMESFEEQKRLNDVLYQYQKVQVERDLAGRQADLFRIFMERNAQLLQPRGSTGTVVPSAFHANEGATGIRRLYLEKMRLRFCYSFENRRKLFEIHRSFKFALVAAAGSGPSSEFFCAFYLQDDEWLFRSPTRQALPYSLSIIASFDPLYLTFPELSDAESVPIFHLLYERAMTHHKLFTLGQMRLKRELTDRDSEFILTNCPPAPKSWEALDDCGAFQGGFLPVLKGEDFWQFDDRYTERPYGVIDINHIVRITRERAIAFFRPAVRKIATSTNERTFIVAIIPPGIVCHESVQVDVLPKARPNSESLAWLAAVNSFPFDWVTRQLVAANLLLFIIERLPIPSLAGRLLFLSHASLRLSCNHSGYTPLWREQLGNTWREAKPAFTWPVLQGDDERWPVRAVIDAVVADASGHCSICWY